MTLLAATVIGVLAVAGSAQASTLTPYAYVTNAGAESVSVINTSTNEVVGQVPVGLTPQIAASTPDGSQVYVADVLEHNLSVIDTSTDAVVATVFVPFPSGIAFAPSGALAYVSAQVGEVGPDVQVIDTTSNSVVDSIPVGICPAGVAITPDGSRVYVVNACSDNVSVIDTATDTVIATIPVGEGPWDITVSPDGSAAYVPGEDSIAVIDTATDTIEDTIPLAESPHFLAITPDGSTIYASVSGGNEVIAIDTATKTVNATIPVGEQPEGLAITPDGSRVYVTNQESDNVSVIDTATKTVSATVPVEDQPLGVAITPPIEGPALLEPPPSAGGSGAAPPSSSPAPAPAPASAPVEVKKASGQKHFKHRKLLKCRKHFKKKRVHGKVRCVRPKHHRHRHQGHRLHHRHQAARASADISLEQECVDAALARPEITRQPVLFHAGIRLEQFLRIGLVYPALPSDCAPAYIRTGSSKEQTREHGRWVTTMLGVTGAWGNQESRRQWSSAIGPPRATPARVYDECINGHFENNRILLDNSLRAGEDGQRTVVAHKRYILSVKVQGNCKAAARSRKHYERLEQESSKRPRRLNRRKGSLPFEPGHYVGTTSQTCPQAAPAGLCLPGRKAPILFTVTRNGVKDFKTVVVDACEAGVPDVVRTITEPRRWEIATTAKLGRFGELLSAVEKNPPGTEEVLGTLRGSRAQGRLSSFITADSSGRPEPEGPVYCESRTVRWRASRL